MPSFLLSLTEQVGQDFKLKPSSFSSLKQMHYKTRTKREIFSDEMEVVAPWARLAALIDPSYTEPRKGRRQTPTELQLRR